MCRCTDRPFTEFILMEAPYAPTPQQPPTVSNYLVQSILVTLFCCLPFGIVAIVFAAQVNGKLQAGDYAGAAQSSKSAKLWCWVSFGIGLVFIIAYTAFVRDFRHRQRHAPRRGDAATLRPAMTARALPGRTADVRRFRPAAWLAAAGAGAAGILWKFDPRTAGFFPPCPFHTVTGCYCPGCGSTRALHALARGDFGAAFRWNALLTVTLPFLAVLAAGEFLLPAVGGRWSLAIPARWLWLYFYVTVAFWIARNVPVYPFALLAPH